MLPVTCESRVPTCARKPEKNTFDESSKFLYWLFFVVSDIFRLFQMILGRARSLYIVLDHFSSFLTLVSNTSSTYKLVKSEHLNIVEGKICSNNFTTNTNTPTPFLCSLVDTPLLLISKYKWTKFFFTNMRYFYQDELVKAVLKSWN